MAHRFAPVRDLVTFELDGERIVAERGEPIAFALVAADKLALARSPKLHRPHGPACLRGACDGCLARVGGEPNVATCMVACAGGETVESQNVLGSRRADLLRVTDWFFPQGMDHHHLLAGVPGLSPLMQRIARRIAGLGTLPDAPAHGEPAERRDVDVLVVGAGAAGLTVAERVASAGRSVLVADDAVTPGGSLRARDPKRVRTMLDRAGRAEIASSTTVAGLYGRGPDALLVAGRRAALVRARAVVLATGAHDGVVAFEGNDLPGVVSARAAALLAANGIAIGARVALAGDGPYTRALVAAAGEAMTFVRIPAGAPFAAHGTARVRAVTHGTDGAETREKVDALAVEAPGAPAFELAEQAGAEVAFDPARGGFVPKTDAGGRAAERVYCAGEVAGVGPALDAIVTHATRVADAVVSSLTTR